jgi:hypothetical protein
MEGPGRRVAVAAALVTCVACLSSALALACIANSSPSSGAGGAGGGGPRGPRVFVGSAFLKASVDMVSRPKEWGTSRQSAGYMLHPLGFKALGHARARSLMRMFDTRTFLTVKSLGGVRDDAGTIMAQHDEALKLCPEFRCAGILLFVATDWLMKDMDGVTKTFARVASVAIRRGVPVFFFMTPLGVKNYPGFLRVMETNDANGQPFWVRIARASGAAGVAIDFPSGHWRNVDARYRDNAVRVARTCAAAGLRFVWALNGYCRSLSEVTDLTSDLRHRGVRPDLWVVDHFEDAGHAGTPETAPTVTGMARAVLQQTDS